MGRETKRLKLGEWGSAKARFGYWHFRAWLYELGVRQVEDGWEWVLFRASVEVGRRAVPTLEQVERESLSLARRHAWATFIGGIDPPGLPL